MKEFQLLLQKFLVDYLPTRRGFSANTIASYRDTFILLLRWMDTREQVRADQVIMADLTLERVRGFTDWLRLERGNSVATTNARISALRSFAKFVQSEAPEHLEICRKLLQVPTVKKTNPREIDFLSVPAVQFVVAAADDNLRELAVVSLLYDSAARVSELCGLTVGDLSFSRPYSVHVVGKGRKARVIPISGQVGELLSRYLAVMRPGAVATDPLFVNRSGVPLGRAGVAYILQKCVTAACKTHPEQLAPKAHPHIMRHSKAMHLLEAGVNLVYIRDFLGHESVVTTEVYARASIVAKRRAIEAAEQNIVPESPYGKEYRADLIAWLKQLL